MSFMDKAHLVILWTVDSGDEGEWDRIFASHGEWMTGHPRQGDAALLSYTISKGPEHSNPLDRSSEPTGKTIYVLDEYYESSAGVARHWEDHSAENVEWPSRPSAALKSPRSCEEWGRARPA